MITLVIVCEGPTDARAAATLQDRLLSEVTRPSGKSANDLQSLRDYRGIERSSGFTQWISLGRKHCRTRRKFGPAAPLPDQRQTREALMRIWEARKQGEPIDGVLVLRDRDRAEGAEREKGMRKALSDFQEKVSGKDGEWLNHVAIGFAVPKLEAWYLAGFVPRTDMERTMLADLHRVLAPLVALAPEAWLQRVSVVAPYSYAHGQEILDLCGILLELGLPEPLWRKVGEILDAVANFEPALWLRRHQGFSTFRLTDEARRLQITSEAAVFPE